MSELTERARRLAEAATPGPWKFFDAHIIDQTEIGTRRMGNREDTVVEASRYGYDELNVSMTDAMFIAQSREIVPALCDENDALAAEVARLREALVECLTSLEGPWRDEWQGKYFSRIAVVKDVARAALEVRQ